MKVRNIVSILLLLGIAATVFYFGWVQILLPEDTYAVAFTKTSGWDEEVMEAGQFHWRWERVIPTNMQLHIFHLQPRSVAMGHSAELPSATLYSDFLNTGVEFRYELEAKLQYTINPADLPHLVAEGGLRAESLEDFYQTLELALHEQIIKQIPTVVNVVAEDTADGGAFLVEIQKLLRSEIQSLRSDIQILNFDITQLSVPDLNLYNDARRNYAAVQSLVTEARAEAQTVAVRREISERSRLEILEQYGRVLADYPELLDYFRLQGESGVDILNLESLQVPVDN